MKSILGEPTGWVHVNILKWKVERFWVEPPERVLGGTITLRKVLRRFWVKPFTDGFRYTPLC